MRFFACMRITCMPQALVGKKRGSDLLELESDACDHDVGTGNLTPILCNARAACALNN